MQAGVSSTLQTFARVKPGSILLHAAYEGSLACREHCYSAVGNY